MAEDTRTEFGMVAVGLGVGHWWDSLCPKSGRETREDIARGAREGSEYLSTQAKRRPSKWVPWWIRQRASSEYVERGRRSWATNRTGSRSGRGWREAYRTTESS